ncbi:MAG TPA: amidohydrolase family protein [Rhodothermales bacterium]|nr:amidohydrolase family protein [Rhodothermales bacterium]
MIRADRALVVESGEMIQDAVVVVRGERIAEFGSGLAIPENARVIDLGNRTLLPGLIDAHTHLAIQPDYSALNPILYKSIPYRTIEAVAGAKATLMAGFTTIRDIDSEGADWADVAVRDAINDGVVPGPRMQVATLSISITGGYMNQNDLAPQIDAPHFGALIDSSDDLVPEVRRQIKNGADFIKIYATGTTRHVNLETMEPMTQFSLDDIKIVVDEAARFGKPVAAHAYGGEGARNAVLAGVRSIEHGMLLDDEIMKLMIERGTFWVPTFSVYMEDGPRSGWSERARKLVEAHEKAFRRALELGVKIAYGTDAGALPHGDNAIDFGIMVDYGMTPLQAIQSATIQAADLMGMSGDVGTLKSGAFADVIAVTGNPLNDATLLGDVEFVMKGGTVYRSP